MSNSIIKTILILEPEIDKTTGKKTNRRRWRVKNQQCLPKATNNKVVEPSTQSKNLTAAKEDSEIKEAKPKFGEEVYIMFKFL